MREKFLFLFTLKWKATLAAPGFPSLMSINGFWKNSVLLLFVVKQEMLVVGVGCDKVAFT